MGKNADRPTANQAIQHGIVFGGGLPGAPNLPAGRRLHRIHTPVIDIATISKQLMKANTLVGKPLQDGFFDQHETEAAVCTITENLLANGDDFIFSDSQSALDPLPTNQSQIMFGIVLLIHILAATVWTGGHLVLALTVLPRALKTRSIEELARFESGYERIGIPSLFLQIVTGFWLAHRLVPDVGMWFDFSHPVSRLIAIKLMLLALTAGLAIDARLRIIPKLTEKNLVSLACHIIPVTVISVLYVVVGVSFRTGWFY